MNKGSKKQSRHSHADKIMELVSMPKPPKSKLAQREKRMHDALALVGEMSNPAIPEEILALVDARLQGLLAEIACWSVNYLNHLKAEAEKSEGAKP